MGAPVTAAEMSLGLLLHPERAARLVQQKAVDKNQLGLHDVLEELISRTIKSSHRDNYLKAVQEAVNYAVFEQLFSLAVNKEATPQVKAITNSAIDGLENWLSGREGVMDKQMLREIKQFRENPEDFKIESTTPKIPDGSPIGSFQCFSDRI